MQKVFAYLVALCLMLISACGPSEAETQKDRCREENKILDSKDSVQIAKLERQYQVFMGWDTLDMYSYQKDQYLSDRLIGFEAHIIDIMNVHGRFCIRTSVELPERLADNAEIWTDSATFLKFIFPKEKDRNKVYFVVKPERFSSIWRYYTEVVYTEDGESSNIQDIDENFHLLRGSLVDMYTIATKKNCYRY